MLKYKDIICLQEHWLYNFEKHKLEEFCSERGFECFLKCSDDADPISPLQRPRGKGGTGILWRNTISRNVKVLPGGSDRVCAIRCEYSDHGSICIINVYLPCRGYKDSDDRFLDTLDEVREILIKYAVNSHVILLGDLNASLHREKPIARDAILKNFLDEFRITTGKNYPTDFTYVHGSGKSTIDYVLQTENNIVKKVEVQSGCGENTSPHSPVMADIAHIPKVIVNPEKDSNMLHQRKINWKKVKVNHYQSLVSSRIRSSISDQDSDINVKVEKVSDILLEASSECAPKASKSLPKVKKLWCPQLKSIANKSKLAHKQWKEAGKPLDPKNELLMNKNNCKKQLRTRQRQIAAEQRNGLYKEILVSHTDDKKLFYKLVNRQRNYKQSSISELIIDDVHVTELEMIRKGWASYFKKLATPVDNDKFDSTQRLN